MTYHRFVAVKGQWAVEVGPEATICVYTPNDGIERAPLSGNIVAFVNQWGCQNYVICGDINTVLCLDERWRVYNFGETLAKLSDFVDTLGLEDLSLEGSKYSFF